MASTRFSLIVGGPFHALLKRLGLVDADDLPRPAAAVVLVALAWGIPVVLVAAQSVTDPGFVQPAGPSPASRGVAVWR